VLITCKTKGRLLRIFPGASIKCAGPGPASWAYEPLRNSQKGMSAAAKTNLGEKTFVTQQLSLISRSGPADLI
jgi:hypothetical protein